MEVGKGGDAHEKKTLKKCKMIIVYEQLISDLTISNAIMTPSHTMRFNMVALDTHQLLAEVDSMPIDLKTKLIEKLLNSLNPLHHDIELWKQEIDSRVASIEKGAVNLIDGNDVFRKIKARFEQ
jgi:hypothetical protein